MQEFRHSTNVGVVDQATLRVVLATGSVSTQADLGLSDVSEAITAASASNVTVSAADAAIHSRVLVNNGGTDAYVKLGATASTSSFTKKLVAGESWTVPMRYTGIIDAIWSGSPSGNMIATTLRE